ncbi:Z1 domain-containing protein [Cellulosimicrobium sp. SH8]|uniref:Z1 domain-containing protein n=1 Tax=Cellulosimicrobium sp. SH8 TaxID=2952936 RepID=UPI0021F2BA1C|nr:Z1 domain-containing protein [Cellulosimicrobium sp. SH8]
MSTVHADIWAPEPGRKLQDLLMRTGLAPDERTRLEKETLRILGRCRAPRWDDDGASAELVVGAVQSGKTLSFTGLIAAAHDNGYPLVVVLAGTKTNLRDQTYERLVRDLAMNGNGRLPSWHPVNDLKPTDAQNMRARVQQWKASKSAATRVTTVAVVLKNHAALRRARTVLRSVLAASPGAPVLFIDDEADQAGLNVARRRGDESSTYRSIRLLRETADNHSYVLYTATPQAPLLIALEDTLSPRTVSVLQAGDGYVGGAMLFEERIDQFVREIDDDALDDQSISPPESLERAVATYLLAMVVAQLRGSPLPLTMLIHPSSGTDLHRAYEIWTHGIIGRFDTSLTDGDPVLKQQVVDEIFQAAYDDLATTDGHVVDDEIVPLDRLVDMLGDDGYLQAVMVRVVNSAAGNEITSSEWPQAPGWIVIGGNKLDRGFTVENLAVTYMPRGPGVRNADTVQQRGRFFGYKLGYLDLLRAWMNPDTADVFRVYVRHEDAMRSALGELDANGEELSTWRRSILLDAGLNPTRREVVRLDVDDIDLSGWSLIQTHVYGEPTGPKPEGRSLLDGLRATAVADDRDNRPTGRNATLRTTWTSIVEILVDWRITADEKDRLYAIVLALGTIDDEIPVDVVFMDGGATRDRGPAGISRAELEKAGWDLDEIDDVESLEIGNLMQGANPADGSVYPGDRAFWVADAVTVEVHELAVEAGHGTRSRATALAIHVPSTFSDRVILQAD